MHFFKVNGALSPEIAYMSEFNTDRNKALIKLFTMDITA